MTYSIVARDPETAEMGVATQSQAFAVGSSVPWGEPGFGVIATQSVAEPFYGEVGLDLLRGGMTATEALTALRSVDPHPERRQLAMVDTHGEIAAYTGDDCIAAAGHATGDGCVALANMAAGEEVWHAMVAAYEACPGPLVTRLLDALEAGEAAGGDVRGQRSAAIMVVRAERSGRPWSDRLVDLRVDEHPEAVRELRRLAEFGGVYHHAVRGFEEAIDGDPNRALEVFGAIDDRLAAEPDHLLWLALAQVAAGDVDAARSTFARMAAAAPHFLDVARRFPAAGILAEHAATVDRLVDEAG